MDEAVESNPSDELVERLFRSGIAALELLTIHLGKELGLYAALARGDGVTAPGLAAAAGINSRYTREWLEQQAAAGLVTVDDIGAPADARVFRLPAEHVGVLLDTDSLAYLVPLGGMIASLGGIMPRLVAAYRDGSGIGFGEYGEYMGEGQAAINRPAFRRLLASEWIPSGLPELDVRLQGDSPAKVLDVGCGHGWSTVALATAYPNIEVVGIDLDPPSIQKATLHAFEAGVGDRVSFRVSDASSPELQNTFDAVFIFEALHDMARPVETLKAIRAARNATGTVVVMDERVAEQFTAPADEVERLMYGWSVLHCLPVGMIEQPSAETGTVMRADTMRRYAEQAGFTDVEIAPIDHDSFRFYRLSG